MNRKIIVILAPSVEACRKLVCALNIDASTSLITYSAGDCPLDIRDSLDGLSNATVIVHPAYQSNGLVEGDLEHFSKVDGNTIIRISNLTNH